MPNAQRLVDNIENLYFFLYGNSNAPLEKDGIIYSVSIDKANLLNDYFCDYTLLDEQNATLPNMPVYNWTILSNLLLQRLK